MLISGMLLLIYLLIILPFKAGNVGEIRGDEVKAGDAYSRVHVYYIDKLQILYVKTDTDNDRIYGIAKFSDCDRKEWIVCFSPGNDKKLAEHMKLACLYEKQPDLTVNGYFRMEFLEGLPHGAIVLLVFTLPITVFCLLAKGNAVIAICISAPGLLLLIWGIYQKKKRTSSWISYYQEQTGFSEAKLQQIDHELLSPSVTIVTCRMGGAAVENYIAGYITEHYVVIDGVYPYIRRLEDIIAVAFSDSTDIWCMVILTVQDQDTVAVTLVTDTQRKPALCTELMQAMYRRNPKILCGQEIVCDGRCYILERDGAQLLRLYRDGRPLELRSKSDFNH